MFEFFLSITLFLLKALGIIIGMVIVLNILSLPFRGIINFYHNFFDKRFYRCFYDFLIPLGLLLMFFGFVAIGNINILGILGIFFILLGIFDFIRIK